MSVDDSIDRAKGITVGPRFTRLIRSRNVLVDGNTRRPNQFFQLKLTKISLIRTEVQNPYKNLGKSIVMSCMCFYIRSVPTYDLKQLKELLINFFKLTLKFRLNLNLCKN